MFSNRGRESLDESRRPSRLGPGVNCSGGPAAAGPPNATGSHSPARFGLSGKATALVGPTEQKKIPFDPSLQFPVP